MESRLQAECYAGDRFCLKVGLHTYQGGRMRLGLNFGYWGAGPADNIRLAQEAERLGYDSLWTAEAWGSDAVTPLVWLAAHTERIRVGTAIMQMPARTPAMTAMTAATADLLTGGRFLLGLGASGPQVVEGWHGVVYGKLLTRTREYLDIAPTVSVVIGDDVNACRQQIKPHVALYVGGMGARGKNFYNDLARRYGYEEEAVRIQDLYLSGKKSEAIAAVPDELVDEVALCGPRERIKDQLAIWRESGVKTLICGASNLD